MHAFSSSSRLVAAVLSLFVGASACSLVVDFDRAKIRASGSGVKGARGGSGGSGTGAAPAGGTSGRGGTGASPGDAGPDAPKPACDLATHEGCAADELCCDSGTGAACRKTSTDECESCGTACPGELAASCSGRSCECVPGSGRACSGQDPELHCMAPSSGAPRCVECRDVTDCSQRKDGKVECVEGLCAACDPASQNAGCSGTTPICDATKKTCKKCSTSDNDCTGHLVCTSSGACGGCAKSSTDCETPTTPICDTKTTQCRGCSGNAECVSELGLPFCVDSQRCSPCDPSTEAGCTDASKPDCRQTGTSDFACQACTADAHCKNLTATPVCNTQTGHCVECAGDADCKGDPKKPLCVGDVCVACDTVSNAADANQRCQDKPGGAPACVTSGAAKGQCGACNPADSTGCAPSELCCESSGVPGCIATSTSQCTACGTACNSALANTCSNRGCRCGSGPACSGTGSEKFCTSSGSCAECRADDDCTSAAAPLCDAGQCVACDTVGSTADARCGAVSSSTPACARSGALKGKCAVCDPAGTGGGCTGSNQCDPATAACVDCVDNSGCSGIKNKCNTTTKKCVDCTVAGGGCTDDPTMPVCEANACRGCVNDAECAGSLDAAGPLCGTSGACAADTGCAGAADCTDGVHGQCVDIGAGVLRCRLCDPSNNVGCSTGETCTTEFACMP